jgi:hypothetical protein
VTTDDTVVHCGVPTARLKIPASGSVRMRCERCDAEIWIDPFTCNEAPRPHAHVCEGCVDWGDADLEVRVTTGSIARALIDGKKN